MTWRTRGRRGKKEERVNLTGGDEKVEQWTGKEGKDNTGGDEKVEQWKGKEGKDNEESHTYQS